MCKRTRTRTCACQAELASFSENAAGAAEEVRGMADHSQP